MLTVIRVCTAASPPHVYMHMLCTTYVLAHMFAVCPRAITSLVLAMLDAASPADQHIARRHRAADAGGFVGQLVRHSALPVILPNMYAKAELCTCRLWPPLNGSLDPKELEPVVDATVACFVDNNSNIVWIPESPEGLQGRWVSCKEACFLPRQAKLSPQVTAAGRRAGLLIPEIPAKAQRVSPCMLAATAVLFTSEEDI